MAPSAKSTTTTTTTKKPEQAPKQKEENNVDATITTITTQTSIAQRASDIFATADKVLAQVDRASIFSTHTVREFPIFEFKEVEFGPELGTGGFSRVQEVTSINLSSSVDKERADDTAAAEETTTTTTTNKEEKKKTAEQEKKEREEANIEMIAQMLMKGTSAGALNGNNGGGDDEHYDIDTARETIAKKCIRSGSGARYAVKKLKAELHDDVERARGALDLAIEIQYLSVLWHPNIVKMRGISKTPKVSTETFLLMDRLYGTLDSRFEEWEQLDAMNRASNSCCGGGGVDKNDPSVREFLKSRLLVAYDLTCAFRYLHDAKLIYRDIKPENIGFDIRGDVKVFDFGLCRSLDRVDKVSNGYGYNLTAKTGSIPYMAPEVMLGNPYDTKADVFSFSVLLWEILSVSWAFNGYNVHDYFVRVVKEHQRMPIKGGGGSWPVMLKSIVKEGWDKDPTKRPTMKRMGTLIRAELNELSETDSTILNRTTHMLNRSQRSFKLSLSGFGGGSSRRGSNGSGRLSRSNNSLRGSRGTSIDGSLKASVKGGALSTSSGELQKA